MNIAQKINLRLWAELESGISEYEYIIKLIFTHKMEIKTHNFFRASVLARKAPFLSSMVLGILVDQDELKKKNDDSSKKKTGTKCLKAAQVSGSM